MKGLPKYLNTAQDFNNAHALALSGDDSMRQAMIAHWQALLNSDQVWVFQKAVGKDFAPGEGEKVMSDEKDEAVHSLFRPVDNPESRMRQLGLSAETIKVRIAELGGE